jgi:Family of unknown function (DUF5335)
MARTIEVPKENWTIFLNALNKRTAGRPVRIEVENMDIGDQQMARQIPLQEISYETKGSDRGSIEIRVGYDTGDVRELTHWVSNASRLYIQENDNGEPECIEIESTDGGKLLIWSEHFPSLRETGEQQVEAP